MTKFKLCLFGDSGVGKTSLNRRFLNSVFEENMKMTIGADLATKQLEVDGKTVGLQIWDFAGEEHYRILFPSFVQDAKGGIYMFDVTDASTLENIDEWLDFFVNPDDRKKFIAPILMVGSKIDLVDNREIQADEAIAIAKKKNLIGYIECSAKTGENSLEIFEAITRTMMKNVGIL